MARWRDVSSFVRSTPASSEMGHFYHVGQSHCGRFLQWKSEKAIFFAFFDFFSIYWNEKISKKAFLSKFRISKKSFFEIFIDFEKSKKNQRMQKNCLFRFLLHKMALSHMMEMSHFARSQCNQINRGNCSTSKWWS